MNTQSIITGGDYDPDTKLLALTGTLIFNEYYILKIEDFDLESKKDYKIDSNVWSVTSYNELRKEAIEVERYNLLNPDKTNKKSHIEKCLSSTEGPIVSASDYIRLNSDQIRPFIRKSFYSFGTDGYGRSDTRKNLRKFFEVDKEHIVAYSLSVLAKEQLIPSKYASEAMQKYNIDPNKTIPTKL